MELIKKWQQGMEVSCFQMAEENQWREQPQMVIVIGWFK